MGPSDPRPLADGRWRGPHGIGRFATEVLARLPGVDLLEGGPAPLSAFDAAWVTWKVRRLRPAVYFSPGFNPPVRARVPVVFTICDLIHVRFPAESGWLQRLYYRAVVRPAARSAYRVLTISEFSKAEIAAWAGIDPAKIEVVGCGVSGAFRPEGERRAGGGGYFLYVGNRKPHKNLDRLLEGFAMLRGREDVRLVLTGDADAAMRERLRRLGVEGRVDFLGMPSDEALAAAYRGAAAAVQPSLYEGFGLPVVEAMACGTPVIAARATALPEVAGEAALYVDPLEASSIAEGMERLLSDGSLRARLSSGGAERVRPFSWDRTGGAVLAVVRSGAEGR